TLRLVARLARRRSEPGGCYGVAGDAQAASLTGKRRLEPRNVRGASAPGIVGLPSTRKRNHTRPRRRICWVHVDAISTVPDERSVLLVSVEPLRRNHVSG